MSIPFTAVLPPTAPTQSLPDTGLRYYYTTRELVEGLLLSAEGLANRMDDDNSGSMEETADPVDELALFVDNVIPAATDEINTYLFARYDPAQIASSWMAVNMCTTLAAIYVCERRGNPVPNSLVKRWERMQDILQRIMDGKATLGTAQQREADFPILSNVRLDSRQPVRQIRVQPPISDPRTPAYRQAIDRASQLLPEPPI